MEANQTSLAQRSRKKVYFDHKDMDYYLSWIMGRQVYDGSEAAECLEAASRIADGDALSWQSVWRTLAERVEGEARTALNHGDIAGARATYLRACTYYRASLFIMRPNEAAFREGWQKMRSCFQQAAALFDPPIETIQVPFEGEPLLGYVWRADDRDGDRKRPTLIVIGGIETFAEDCYFMIGSAGPRRGYDLLTVDLPGQGINPEKGLYFSARMEVPMQAVIDYALKRPDTEAERLAVFGFSWGGHIVFKAAQHDRRIKALIANPAMPNVLRAALAQQQGHNRNDPITRIIFDQIVWRMGLRISLNPADLARRVAKAYDYLTHGRADSRKILCPTLCLAGAGEAPITLQIARECFEQLPHPMKKLMIFTEEQGGEAHCQVDNLALPNTAMFDWLDSVFS